MTSRRFIPAARLARLCAVAVLVLAPVFLASPAAAQRTELRPLLDRLDRMERELNLLQRQVYQGRVRPRPVAPAQEAGGLAPKVAARMEVRLTELESGLRDLTGKLEEMSFALEQLRARIEKLVGDVDMRLSQLERATATGRAAEVVAAAPEGLPAAALAEEGAPGAAPVEGAGAGAAVPGAPVAEAPPSPPDEVAAAMSVLPEGTPREQYDFVFAKLVRRDYSGAEKGLRAFIALHPDDALAENAQYWLGETYYVRSDYANAAVVFAEGYQRFSDGPKAPDNLLKLAMSLARLDEKEQACKVLAELGRKFPDAALNIRKRAAKEKTRIGCE